MTPQAAVLLDGRGGRTGAPEFAILDTIETSQWQQPPPSAVRSAGDAVGPCGESCGGVNL